MYKKSQTLFLSILWLTLLAGTALSAEIVHIENNTDVVSKYEKFEITMVLSESYSDPFDPEVIDISVIFHGPDGIETAVPGFYYRQYEASEEGLEFYRNPGPGLWKVRFAADKAGDYTYDVRIVDQDGPTEITDAGNFECTDGDRHGFIRVDQRDRAYLCYDDNSPRINIGHNVCWVIGGGVNEWGQYFSSMNSVGENWTRIWMCPFGGDGGTILEYNSTHSSGYFDGAGQISLQVAQRIDGIIEHAEQNGIGIQLVLQYHGAFSTSTDSNWSGNPYNTVGGGFLDDPADFFTDSRARQMTKNKYRYIIARWGYSEAILAWELWNEVQFTDGWKTDQSSVVQWHNEMSQYIRNIDPFEHLITTSSDTSGFDSIWQLQGIDLIQKHHYSGRPIGLFQDYIYALSVYNKPVIIGEFGAGSTTGVSVPEKDPDDLPEPYKSQVYDGLLLHNGIWSAFHSKSSAHLWWWDHYIEKLNLYDEFSALSLYADGQDQAGENLSKADRVVSGFESLFAIPGQSSFLAVSEQTEFTLTDGRFEGIENLTQWLHGSWKPDYKSDPEFSLTMPTAGSFLIHVLQVSDYGSNSLRILLDGNQIFASGYDKGASNFTIEVALPAGTHSVQVINTGQDWFKIASYEFAPEQESLLNSIGLTGNDTAYLWIYDKQSQFGDYSSGIFTNEMISVPGLKDGLYNVKVYATRGPGGIIRADKVNSLNGLLEYILPDFERDIAVKILPVCIFDIDDLLEMTTDWLQSDGLFKMDLNNDRKIDLLDFSQLSTHWQLEYPYASK